jgi:hypothetical protein
MDEILVSADFEQEGGIEKSSAVDEPRVGIGEVLQALNSRCRHRCHPVQLSSYRLVSRRSAQLRLAVPCHACRRFPLLVQSR